MAVPDGTDHLSKEVHANFFGESSAGVDESEEIALVDILEDEVSVELVNHGTSGAVHNLHL